MLWKGFHYTILYSIDTVHIDHCFINGLVSQCNGSIMRRTDRSSFLSATELLSININDSQITLPDVCQYTEFFSLTFHDSQTILPLCDV